MTTQTPAEAFDSPRDALRSLFNACVAMSQTNKEGAERLLAVHATLARAVEGAEGDDNNLPEPFPRVHSYDPSGARRTVTVQWGEDSFVSYVRYGDRSTWKEIPPINETPVERPAPSAGVGQDEYAELLRLREIVATPPEVWRGWKDLCEANSKIVDEIREIVLPNKQPGNVVEAVRALATPPASAAGGGSVSVTKEEILRIARMAEGLKRECGMDPESPQAIRNGQYMNISHALRAMLAAQGGSDK